MTREGRALRPESRGRVLSAFLQHYFARYVDYGFTAALEDQLDHVSGEPVTCFNLASSSSSNSTAELSVTPRQGHRSYVNVTHAADDKLGAVQPGRHCGRRS